MRVACQGLFCVCYGAGHHTRVVIMKLPQLNPDTPRDEVSEADLRDAARMLLAPAPDRPRAVNKEPTKAQLAQRWRLRRVATGKKHPQ